MDVFINCPFDDTYLPLFDAILFTLYSCEHNPRCSLEIDDGSQFRLQNIYNLIEDCDLSIHDVSCVELDSSTRLPRFNMPLELGIFLGAKQYGGKRQKSKRCLIFDTEKYRYQKFISDIAGQDIRAHNQNPEELIKQLRGWLKSIRNDDSIPGVELLIRRFNDYNTQRPSILTKLHVSDNNLEYADRIQVISHWLKITP